MPNIDSLIKTISQKLSNAPQETAKFTTLYLQYAYSQLNLHSDTAHHCNFNIVSGDMTGTYHFKTGFCGLTDMPADFQKAFDCTLAGLTNTFCFLDDILIVIRGRIEDHLDLLRKCLIKLDQQNLGINLTKYHFAKDKIEWLGDSITQAGITPLSIKTDTIEKFYQPEISKHCDLLWDQYIISENIFQIYCKCVTHLDFSLRKTQNLSGQLNMNNISS